MIKHSQANGVELDDNDMMELIKKLYAPWDLNKKPATKFTNDDKSTKQLLKKNITAQPLLHCALAKSAFQVAQEHEFVLSAFKSKPEADQTFINLHPFIMGKYSKH